MKRLSDLVDFTGSPSHCPDCEAELQHITISEAIFEGVIEDGVQFDCHCRKCGCLWTQLYVYDCDLEIHTEGRQCD